MKTNMNILYLTKTNKSENYRLGVSMCHRPELGMFWEGTEDRGKQTSVN
jgi:hypothetical protein